MENNVKLYQRVESIFDIVFVLLPFNLTIHQVVESVIRLLYIFKRFLEIGPSAFNPFNKTHIFCAVIFRLWVTLTQISIFIFHRVWLTIFTILLFFVLSYDIIINQICIGVYWYVWCLVHTKPLGIHHNKILIFNYQNEYKYSLWIITI